MHRRIGFAMMALAALICLSGCDSELVERGSRYIERLRTGLIYKLTAKISENRETLTIQDFLPAPNYERNTDSGDKQQLVDGKLVRPPIWLDKGSVGWFGHTPVLIEAFRSNPLPSDGKIRIHAGLGLYAGISLPRRIDVYSNTDGGMRLVGSYHERGNLSLEDKRSYWLEVPVRQVGGRVVVALHAKSSYLQIDEIEFVPDSAGGQKTFMSENLPVQSLDEIRQDASAQLRLGFEMQATDRSVSKGQWREAFGRNSIVSWIADPWIKDPGELEPQMVDTENTRISVTGFNREHEVFAVGLYNTGSGLEEVEFNLSGLKPGSFEIMQVERVLTAHGKTVYDPLVPVSDNRIKLQAGWPYLLWISLDLRRFETGRTQGLLHIQTSRKSEKSFPLTVLVSDSGQLADSSLDVSVWGYSSDTPVWNDPGIAIGNQLQHYVNTWVIHPENIPGLELDGKMENHKLERFRRDLQLYKGKGLLRLYFGWTLQKNPLGLSLDSHVIDKNKKNAFDEWLKSIDTILKAEGYTDQDWEFYPFDEPSGPALLALKSIAEQIKKTLPGRGIYTDPVSTHSHPTQREHLDGLLGLIDNWQPELEFVRGSGGEFFSQLNTRWGFYHNPPVPAKSADPIAHYRAQGWWAWRLGATAIGFWSFSDSTGSSVWDDFDGRRPDFSVVYEKSGGLVSSRRWEAFAEGIEDYQLLNGSGLKYSDDLNLKSLGTREIQQWRRRALEALN